MRERKDCPSGHSNLLGVRSKRSKKDFRSREEEVTVEEIKNYIVSNTPDPAIALAQAQAESNFNPNAVSGAGARGLFQFLPSTFAQYGSGDIFSVEDSTAARNAYMSYLLGLAGGDYAIALGAYNAGEGRVILGYRDSSGKHHNGLVQDYGSDWLAHAPAETRGYVAKILGNQVSFYRAILKTLNRRTQGKPMGPKGTRL